MPCAVTARGEVEHDLAWTYSRVVERVVQAAQPEADAPVELHCWVVNVLRLQPETPGAASACDFCQGVDELDPLLLVHGAMAIRRCA